MVATPLVLTISDESPVRQYSRHVVDDAEEVIWRRLLPPEEPHPGVGDAQELNQRVVTAALPTYRRSAAPNGTEWEVRTGVERRQMQWE